MAASTRKSKRNQNSRPVPFTLGPVARQRIVGSGLLVLGAVSALSLLFSEGPVTRTLADGVRHLAGMGAMAIPIALIWTGAAVLHLGPHGGLSVNRRQAAGTVVALLCLLGLVHLLPLGPAEYQDRAAAGQGGGYVGFLVVFLLVTNFQMTGIVLVLFAAAAGGILATGWVPRPHPIEMAKRLWDGYRTRQAERAAQERESAEQERVILINQGLKDEPAVTEPPKKAQPAARTSASSETPAEEPEMQNAPSRRGWILPPIDIFESLPATEISQVDITQRARTIEDTLKSFGVEARVIEVNQGPAVTQFGVEPGVGVKVARILSLANDLALRLAAAPLRLEAPVPGKQVVGVEVPNGTVSVVCLRDLLESQSYLKHKGRLRLALGRGVSGLPVVSDLAKMPHLLIAGATGSGKSVCLNSFIAAMLYQCTPDDLRMLMIDPKMVEMAPFNGIPHLLTPVVCEMDKVVPALKWVTKEMERRYRMFAARGVRNIEGYNRAATGKGEDLPLPYIVVIIDELADLMMTAPDDVEKILCRLAQLARATGIHLIVATQRPSVDVVTGLIKANFPTRIAFAVTSQTDSRVILDQSGAEKLLGRGDMLFMPTDAAKPMRVQGTYVSDGEILELVSYWKKAIPTDYSSASEQVAFEPVEEGEEGDDLYEEVVEEVSKHSKVSTSFLQRRFKIGYNRAARLMELLEENGVVGSSDSGKARDVLTREEYADEDLSAPLE